MGDRSFDIILFALVAAFLCYRLWSVLGRRNPIDPPTPKATIIPPGVATGNVVPLATRLAAPLAPRPVDVSTDPLGAGIAAIRGADPNFRPETFLSGARQAFEMIVKAFAEGDTATLRPLLSDEVYDTFAETIRQRIAHKETVETKIVRMAQPEILEARLDGRSAIVVVKFVSFQLSVTRNAEGAVVEGDPDQPVERTDLWSFGRNTRSSDPNWALIGTGAPE
jgi:predicted lipid-binding transport protein (Tim44 family)